eukprot:COSAG01_NODE_38554_length_488_cov_0.838046_1_plen_113_part_00
MGDGGCAEAHETKTETYTGATFTAYATTTLRAGYGLWGWWWGVERGLVKYVHTHFIHTSLSHMFMQCPPTRRQSRCTLEPHGDPFGGNPLEGEKTEKPVATPAECADWIRGR